MGIRKQLLSKAIEIMAGHKGYYIPHLYLTTSYQEAGLLVRRASAQPPPPSEGTAAA
jgi:hypothetical protein